MPLDSSPLQLDTHAPPPAGSSNAPPTAPRPGGGLKRTHSLIPTPPQTERKKAKLGAGRGLKARVVPPAAGGRLLFHQAGQQKATKKSKARAAAAEPPVVLPFGDPFARGFKTPSPPSTPKTVEKVKEVQQEEPNPFLVSQEEEERMREMREAYKLSGPKRAPIEEQPTITYVFRGVRQTFTNPLFGRPTSTQASQLPLSHPDYSPPPNVAPRLLFPPGSTKETVERDLARDAGGRLRSRVENVERMGVEDVDMEDAPSAPVDGRPRGVRIGSENASMSLVRGIR